MPLRRRVRKPFPVGEASVTAPPVRIATIGAAFSANKGAASMAQAVVDRVPEVVGPCQIDVLTTYPTEDRAEQPTGPVRIVSLRPRQLVVPVLPIALLVWLVRKLGGSGRSVASLHPATRSLHRADIVLDLAGISFADGRSFPILVYNVLMTGVPLLLGCTVIKCSQAVGPFHRRLNRIAARRVLPRVRVVLTRGERTHAFALELGLVNAERADDLAFLMEVPDAAQRFAARLVEDLGITGPFISFAPSAVVRAYCAEHGLDYVAMMAELVRHIRTSAGRPIVVVPHSARPGQPESRMNDLPVCRDLVAAVDDPEVSLIDRSLRPAELRAVIGASDALITSRFHAMISALAMTTPALVVGWSHKYAEVLQEFGAEDLAVPYDRSDGSTLPEAFDLVWFQREQWRQRIEDALPKVLARAGHNLEVIERELRATSDG